MFKKLTISFFASLILLTSYQPIHCKDEQKKDNAIFARQVAFIAGAILIVRGVKMAADSLQTPRAWLDIFSTKYINSTNIINGLITSGGALLVKWGITELDNDEDCEPKRVEYKYVRD